VGAGTNYVKNAVKKLNDLMSEAHNTLPGATVRFYIQRITDVDRRLSQIAISDAQTAGANQERIVRAVNQLNEGDADVAEGKFAEATRITATRGGSPCRKRTAGVYQQFSRRFESPAAPWREVSKESAATTDRKKANAVRESLCDLRDCDDCQTIEFVLFDKQSRRNLDYGTTERSHGHGGGLPSRADGLTRKY